MIRIEAISKKFRKLQALDNISAQFEKGQAISLIGPNGSGKTTLIKCILGMVRPNKGNIYVGGHPVKQEHEYRRMIGYMPQIGRYPDNMRIGQLFSMMKQLRNDKQGGLDETLVQQFGLKKIYDKPMRTLSGGTRQKVSAALAFLFDPAILILDEPTAALDVDTSAKLVHLLINWLRREPTRTLLWVTHDTQDIMPLADKHWYMDAGVLTKVD